MQYKFPNNKSIVGTEFQTIHVHARNCLIHYYKDFLSRIFGILNIAIYPYYAYFYKKVEEFQIEHIGPTTFSFCEPTYPTKTHIIRN